MLSNPYFIQAIGFIAFGLGVFSVLQKDDNRLRLIMMGQAFTLGIHFILLGAYTGAASVFVTGIRNGVSVFPWAKKFAFVFYAGVIGFGYAAYQTPVDALPIMAGVVGTTAFFFLSGVRMRLTLVCASLLWLTHNVIAGSIGPAIMEIFMTGTGLYRSYTLWRDIPSRPLPRTET